MLAKTSTSYDLKQDGTQTFYIPNEDGSYDEIIIEKISGNTRVDNGTYKITHKALAWTAGFYVTIYDNKINNAYSPFYTVAIGNVSNDYLIRNNSTTATYSFLYTALGVSFSTGGLPQLKTTI